MNKFVGISLRAFTRNQVTCLSCQPKSTMMNGKICHAFGRCSSSSTLLIPSRQMASIGYNITNLQRLSLSGRCSYAGTVSIPSRQTASVKFDVKDFEMQPPAAGSGSSSAENSENEEGSNLHQFDIAEPVLKKLKAKGIDSLFNVQVKSFQHIIEGNDMLVQSRTGTGKTLAFALPIMLKLVKSNEKKLKSQNAIKPGRSPRVVVLAPTRELAKQISVEFESLVPNGSGLTVLSVYGGVPYQTQVSALSAGVDILVGAPGRVKDLLDQGRLKLNRVRHVVLDEVDRMLDLGFRDAVDTILETVYSDDKTPQTLLFSATLPPWVEQTAGKYLKPETTVRLDLISHDGGGRASQTVEHLAILSPIASRSAAIGDLIRVRGGGSTGRCIVFCERKRDADELAAHSAMSGDCHVLHGDIPQEKREFVLKKFREGKYRVLVTTDVAARGIDIPNVDLVIQCQPPKDTEAYIHRSGRTGRAGRSGVAVTFYTMKEESELKRVERMAKIKFKRTGAPSAEDMVTAAARDSLSDLKKVSEKTIDQLKESASEIIEEMGAERALAAALAVLSGKTEIVSRSLLSAREGFTAYVLHTTAENVRGKGYVYGALRRCLEPEQVEKVQYVTFTKDRRSLVFDLPIEMDDEVTKRWTDGKYDTLELLKELPELEEIEYAPSNNRNFNSNYQERFSHGGNGFQRNNYNNRNNGYSGNNNFRGGNKRPGNGYGGGGGGFGGGAKRQKFSY